MKNPKLRVRVGCVDRDFYLFRPRGQRNWYIKFFPPSWVRGSLGVRRVNRSTQTCEIEPARRIAGQIIESYWRDAGASAELNGLTAHVGFASIGDVLARYFERARERPVTVKSNANALRMVVRSVLGGEPELRSTTVLTADLIRSFEAIRGHGRSSTGSYVRQAKSVLALRKMKFYEGLKLPDLTGFRAECVDAAPVMDLEPLDMDAMRAMDAATPKLAMNDPAVYVAHLLFAYLGLRNIEILHARSSWIVDGRIGIIARPDHGFKPKGRSAWLRIAPDVLAEILRFQYMCSDGYLVPGPTMTDRHRAIYRRHSVWVKTWIVDRTKTSYELRRYAGSRLMDLGASIFEVRDFLRHRDVQTTQRWYAYRLQNRDLPVIGMADLVPRLAASA